MRNRPFILQITTSIVRITTNTKNKKILVYDFNVGYQGHEYSKVQKKSEIGGSKESPLRGLSLCKLYPFLFLDI
jgi:hypothetical protein